jgi:7,8-didemethyl-8-hydroxy-5-deazariboflavin synthase CofH subunit
VTEHADNPIGACLNGLDRGVARALGGCLDGRELAPADALALLTARGRELLALCVVADTMRERQAGGDVTYVVNRNINFTNVCVKTCQFCAFSRDLRSEEGYLLDPDEIVRRALEAREVGATEICLQAGLPPTLRGRLYIDLCETLKRAAPDLHLHAFSPEEVKYGATRAKMSIREYLEALRDAGLGSLPGTSAEILDDTLRARISPGRISTSEWVTVIRTAHEVGLPTTSTMMFGHVETLEQRVRHMELLRDLQRDTGGFTEFVPLSFVHQEAPLFARATQPGVSPGPTGDDVVRLYAVARLMLGPTFRNIQASWVKEGPRVAQWLLSCGVNDLGGTLINESISTSAGAGHGQLMTPATLRRLVRDAGRVPVQRNTVYEALRRFDGPVEQDPVEALDAVTDPARFGSYSALVADPRFRYEDAARPE